jgi:hypothetical protein
MTQMPLLQKDAWETATSRETTWSAQGAAKTQTREIQVKGFMTGEEALGYCLSRPPGDEGQLPSYIPYNAATQDPPLLLRSIKATANDNPEIWTITGEYSSLVRDDLGRAVDYTFSGTTSGASQTVTQGIVYTKYGTGPDYQGAINVNPNGVDGVDIVIPKLEFQIDKVLPKGTLWFAYLMTLVKLTGTVNEAAFGPFARGEVLYLGTDFSQKGGGETSFIHKFVGSPNRTAANGNALTIGGINNIEKMGHDYLWIDYVATDNAGFVIRQPRTVHVHQVYPYADFSQLRI